MAWEIEWQEEGKGEDKELVPCKWVKMFPKSKLIGKGAKAKRESDGFGMLGFPVLSMKLKHTSGVVQRIGWSNYHRQPFGRNVGQWKWVFKEAVDGKGEDSTTFQTLDTFFAFLRKRIGSDEQAKEIITLFVIRMKEIMGVSQKQAA